MLRKERGQSHLCRISRFHSDAFRSGCFSLAQLWVWSLSSAKPVNGVSSSQSGPWTPLAFISDVNLRLWQPKMLSLGWCIWVRNSQCWFLLLPLWPNLVLCSTWRFSFLYGMSGDWECNLWDPTLCLCTEEFPWRWVSGGSRWPSGYLHCQGWKSFLWAGCAWSALQSLMLLHQLWSCLSSSDRAARCPLQKAQDVFLVFQALTLLSPHALDL